MFMQALAGAAAGRPRAAHRLVCGARSLARATRHLVLLAGLAACHESALVAPAPEPAPRSFAPPDSAAGLRVALDCQVDVRAGSLACAPSPEASLASPAGRSSSLTIGGQGIYVRLFSTTSVFDTGTRVLAASVSVQNLLSQALGTNDGVTADPAGVRVFFHELPTPTFGGTGIVTVRNPDGYGTFTGSGQPYFAYREVIDANATSQSKTWQFDVPSSVFTFAFRVYVQAALRDEVTSLASQPPRAFGGTIAVGNSWSCAVRTGAGAFCWGANGAGQLGVGVRGAGLGGSSPSASAAVLGPSMTSGGTGLRHGCGLTTAGALYCWGANDNNQLGDGTNFSHVLPATVTMPAGETFARLAVGDNHNCALTADGRAYCWGLGNAGQLGTSSFNNASVPTAVVMPAGVTFTVIAVGSVNSCALTATGAAYCWGDGTSGTVGNGSSLAASIPTPVTMPVGQAFASLDVGSSHSCALSTDGTAFCWGANGAGQVGDDTGLDRFVPTAVSMPAGETFANVALGDSFSCALATTGAAWCWGYGVGGQLGDGIGGMRYAPSAVAMPNGVTFAGLGAGGSHACALTTTGAAWCWGGNIKYQGGDGTQTQHDVPAAATMGGLAFVRIGAGGESSCGLTAEGSMVCWGSNDYVQLGNLSNSITSSGVPLLVRQPAVLASVDVGRTHSCGLSAVGAAYCWGANTNGQLGDGTTTARPVAGAVTMPAGVTFTSITAGAGHTCALAADGTAWCWGFNTNGQLGNGTTVRSTVPVPATMPAGETFTQVVTENNHSCALATSGSAYCWGLNGGSSVGAIGDGTSSLRTTPTAVTMPSGVTFKAVTVGGGFSCALSTAGAAYCWGVGSAGQLGNGGISTRSTPFASSMPSGVTFDVITGGGTYACAIDTVGAAWCWGAGAGGVLGNGSTLNRSLPTAVAMPAGVSFSDISGGVTHSCAATATGTAWCWGNNNVGQLGIAASLAQTTPVQVTAP